MSQERTDRQEDRSETGTPVWRRVALYAVLLLAAFGAGTYVRNRSQHKHDAFARCLTERGVKMFGAWWCPHCVEQKEKFGLSFEYAPYVECGIKGDVHGKAQVCKDGNIKGYPTWQFPPTGERVEQVLTLKELSDRTGCVLP